MGLLDLLPVIVGQRDLLIFLDHLILRLRFPHGHNRQVSLVQVDRQAEMRQEAHQQAELKPSQHPALQPGDAPEQQADHRGHARQPRPTVVEDPGIVELAGRDDYPDDESRQDQDRAVDRPKLVVEVGDLGSLHLADGSFGCRHWHQTPWRQAPPSRVVTR